MKNERLYKVLLRPHVSEKAARLQAEANQYVFEVARDATRDEVRAAVELMFGEGQGKIEVTGVRIVNVPSRRTGYRGRRGRQGGWKKAYVRLAAGQSIELSEADKA